LTRRLCDVAQDISITKHDCGCKPKDSLTLSEIIEGGNIIVSLSDRVLGRTAAEDIKHPITGEVILNKKKIIDEIICEQIDTAGVKSVKVHSVITCISKRGVCALCYGRDLSRGKIVSQGEAIGMIAAQSIGEPGTQLTMRTFHVGGTAQIKEESQIVAHAAGKIKIGNRNVIEDSKKNKIIMGRNTQISIEDKNGRQLAIYKVPYGSKLFYDSDEEVAKGKKICEWDPYTLPVIAEKSGIVSYMDLVDGVSLAETVDDMTGIASKSVLDWRSQSKNAGIKT
jgi:DNA-directed RNA polymerase, beta'' subunit/160 kD subunit